MKIYYEPARPFLEPCRPLAGIPSRLPRIFVVDDEETIAWTVTLILNKYGFDATAFCNPEDLLECSKESVPDLVISDMVMPQMNGIELSVRLKQAYPQCKVMLCSGQAATLKLLDVARKDGHILEVFPKPFNPTKLISHVRRLLSEEPLETRPAM